MALRPRWRRDIDYEPNIHQVYWVATDQPEGTEDADPSPWPVDYQGAQATWTRDFMAGTTTFAWVDSGNKPWATLPEDPLPPALDIGGKDGWKMYPEWYSGGPAPTADDGTALRWVVKRTFLTLNPVDPLALPDGIAVNSYIDDDGSTKWSPEFVTEIQSDHLHYYVLSNKTGPDGVFVSGDVLNGAHRMYDFSTFPDSAEIGPTQEPNGLVNGWQQFSHIDGGVYHATKSEWRSDPIEVVDWRRVFIQSSSPSHVFDPVNDPEGVEQYNRIRLPLGAPTTLRVRFARTWADEVPRVRPAITGAPSAQFVRFQ